MIIGVAAVALVALIAFGVFNSNNGNGSNTAADNRNEAQAVPEQQAPAQPTNFEEWLSVNNPNFSNDLRNSLLRAYTAGIADYSCDVSGNQVTVIMFSEMSSDSAGLGTDLLMQLSNYIASEAAEQSYVNAVKGWEDASGMGPITYHLECRYMDGPIISSNDYTSKGKL